MRDSPAMTLLVGALGLGLLGAGCEQQKPRSDATRADAASADQPAVDPALARAVAAANQGAPAASAAEADGPPETGVFGAGEADRQIRKGDPAKLTLGSTGNEPRVTLDGQMPQVGKKLPLTVALAQSQGRGRMPTITFDVTLEANRPKDVAPGAPLPFVEALVTFQKVSAPQFPKEEADRLAKLKGSRARYQISADGAGTNATLELARGAAEELDQISGNLVELLLAVSPPYPKEAVGVGAYWMATTRESVLGHDVVSYRMVKVQSIEGDKVTLSVGAKRYAASDRFSLPDAKDLTLVQFQSVQEGTVVVKPGGGFPESARMTSQLAAVVAQPGSQRGIPLQVQVDMVLERK